VPAHGEQVAVQTLVVLVTICVLMMALLRMTTGRQRCLVWLAVAGQNGAFDVLLFVVLLRLLVVASFYHFLSVCWDPRDRLAHWIRCFFLRVGGHRKPTSNCHKANFVRV